VGSPKGGKPSGFQQRGPRKWVAQGESRKAGSQELSPNGGPGKSPKRVRQRASPKPVLQGGCPKGGPTNGTPKGSPLRGFRKRVSNKGVHQGGFPCGVHKECSRRVVPKGWSSKGCPLRVEPKGGSPTGGQPLANPIR
jgi:hypothetical protein